MTQCAVVWTAVLAAAGSGSWAQSSIDGVEAGKASLQERRDLPWYDPETDSVRPVELKPQVPPPEVDGRTWRVKEEQEKAAAAGRGLWSMTGFWRVVEVLAWVVVAAILIGLIYMFVRKILDHELDETMSRTFEAEEEIEEGKVEHLPFQIAATRSDFLAEAKRLFDNGNYGDAIVYLFSFELLQLDRHQHIHLTKGKTNRQYLRELRRRPDLADILTRTMLAFEDYFFGHHEISRDRFLLCWEQVEPFRDRVQLERAGRAVEEAI